MNNLGLELELAIWDSVTVHSGLSQDEAGEDIEADKDREGDRRELIRHRFSLPVYPLPESWTRMRAQLGRWTSGWSILQWGIAPIEKVS